MRIIIALPLLLAAAACSVDTDPANDQVTLDYDEQQIENATEDVGNAAEQATSDLGNAARDAGQAIENEVGDIDVDISRNPPDETPEQVNGQ